MGEVDIVKRVTLLAIMKKKSDESLVDVMRILVDTGMFDIVEASQVFNELEDMGYISGDSLTMMGVSIAQKAQQEFKQS